MKKVFSPHPSFKTLNIKDFNQKHLTDESLSARCFFDYPIFNFSASSLSGGSLDKKITVHGKVIAAVITYAVG